MGRSSDTKCPTCTKAAAEFRRRHHAAMEAAHKELLVRLKPDYLGFSDENFVTAVAAYGRAMGYLDDDTPDRIHDAWHDAVNGAWRHELKEKGININLVDAVDRAIRESTIAIGKPWPQSAVKPGCAVPPEVIHNLFTQPEGRARKGFGLFLVHLRTIRIHPLRA
jgi:hypothetical protein